VARVGDIYIAGGDLDVYAELLIISQGYDFDEVTDTNERRQIKESVLDYMVQIEIMRSRYAAADALPEGFEDELQSFMTELKGNEEIMSGFTQKGIGDDTLRYYLESQYYQAALANEATEEDTLPTQEEVEKFYYEHQLEFVSPDERRVSHILVGTAELLDSDRALITEIRDKIASGEATFEDMAAQYGSDGTKDTGGDLGYAQPGAYVEPFDSVAFSLGLEELSDVIETQYGFHILKVTDIQTAHQQTLDEATDVIRQEIQRQLIDDKLAELVAAADVEYLSAEYPAPENRLAVGDDGLGDLLDPELEIVDAP
jgi:cell division protein FtsI/penicillin-binding protein 2